MLYGKANAPARQLVGVMNKAPLLDGGSMPTS